MDLKKVCLFQSFNINEIPDCVQSGSGDRSENYAKWEGRYLDILSVLLKMDKMKEVEVVEIGDDEELGVTGRKDE